MSCTPGFDPARPWDAVFRVAVSEPAFWDSEVRDKAILYLTRISTAAQTLDDGTIADAPVSHRPPRSGSRGGSTSNTGKGKGRSSQSLGTQPGKRGKGGKQQGKSASPGSSRGNSAAETCYNFNRGACNQTPCPAGRRHICTSCGGSHPATACTAGNANAKGGKGRGGGGKAR